MSHRTPQEKCADEFDLALFNLLSRAESFAETSDRNERMRWLEARSFLAAARAVVRPMMHADDRKAT